MNKKCNLLAIITLSFMFTVFWLLPVQAQEKLQTDSLTIQDALDKAYASSTELKKNVLERKRAAKYRDDAAEAVTWMPQIGVVVPAYQAVMNSYQQAEINLETARKTEQMTRDKINNDVISAYTTAQKNYNNIEIIHTNLEKLKQQKRVASLAKEIGMLSDYEYDSYNTSITQLETTYRNCQSLYRSSISSLSFLLDVKDSSWNPQLISKPVLNEYIRDELSIEINRGTSQSVQVWTQKALRDIERSKEQWVLPNISNEIKDINRQVAELNYQQATRDITGLIESRYYGIDAQETQVTAKEEAFHKAERDLDIGRLRFGVGIIPRYASNPAIESLHSLEKALEIAEMELENARIDLVKQKSDFAFLTGQQAEVYDSSDWK